MAARRTGRYLAPIALLAAAAAIALVVKDHVHSTTTTHASTSSTRPAAHQTRGHHASRRHRAKFWTVKQGNTLSAISVATGVPIPAIQRLNPNLNPNALQTGQRLRLRR
jgi:LysM repeat protein